MIYGKYTLTFVIVHVPLYVAEYVDNTLENASYSIVYGNLCQHMQNIDDTMCKGGKSMENCLLWDLHWVLKYINVLVMLLWTQEYYYYWKGYLY
jgi:hypothetical protein